MDIESYFKSLGVPQCGVSVNGEYLENVIYGYRTSSVSGRNNVTTDINEATAGYTDGAKYRRKRQKTKEIEVVFHITANTKAECYTNLNQAKRLLSNANSKFIFSDEDDVYIVGTASDISFAQFDSGSSDVLTYQGKYTIHCSVPYKYSVEEHVVTPTLDNGSTFLVDYKGTKEAYPVLEATMKGDNGFVAYVDSDSHILQFGNPDEVDGETHKGNELLLTLNNFINAADDKTGTDVMHPSYGVKGTLTTATWYDTKFLKFGTKGDAIGNANGGLRTVTVPADSSGSTSCKNFYTYFHLLLYANEMGQTGEMSISWLTSDNKMIAAVNFYKTDSSGNTGYYELWANGKILKTYSYLASHLQDQNPWFWDWGHCDLKKEGSKLTFFYQGEYPEFTIPEVKSMSCAKIQISIKQWGDRSGTQFLKYLGINTFNFYKMNADIWKDVPNKFANGNVLSVDCGNGDVKNNGMPAPSLGAIGNQWEDFLLRPGLNQIKCVNSGWVTQPPDYKLKYREVFL